MDNRRKFIKQSGLLTAAALVRPNHFLLSKPTKMENANRSHWADGSRLVISISMQFEAGGEPETGFDSPFPPNLKAGFTDLPAKTWFQYGYKEGIPRMLELWDKHDIKVTSHTIGEAARHNPELAKEIVKRGHEMAGHGLNWTPQYTMAYEEEKQFIQQGSEMIRDIVGIEPIGYNCNWLRRSKNTIKILQELGFKYHIDDLSRDEPFIIPVDGKHFGVVPYTLRCNDIQLLEGRYFTSTQFGETLKLEFDQLYQEGLSSKKMMSISTHDRISGTPAQVNVLDQFLQYAKQHQGVHFMRKDQIVTMTLNDKNSLIDTDYI